MIHKVCVTGLRGFPNVMGGIETHCENLYPRLLTHAPDFRFVVFARSPYVEATACEHAGIPIKSLPAPKNRYLETIVHTTFSVWHARFVERADILHVHAIGPCLVAPLARALGLRVVATHHGHDYQRQKWGRLARTMLRLGEALMVRFADRIICVSASSAQALRRAYPDRAHSITYLPNGAGMPVAVPDASALLDELGIGAAPFVLAVGRLVPEKGFHDLIEAFERTAGDTKLLIVGAADHADGYSAALVRRASARIVFAGSRDRATLSYLYRRAALFVLPSYHEGHPIVALEALACGTPILLSDIPANREIGLDPRHFFPVGDVATLAQRLRQDDYADLRVVDPTVVERFDWDRIAQGTATVLYALTNQAAR